jgi:SAM-dependent methyltransferase
MADPGAAIRISMDIALPPEQVFDTFVEELAVALAQIGMGLEAGPNGRATEGEREVGRVTSWQPGESIQLQWHPADWQAEETTDVRVYLEPIDSGTRLTLEHLGWGGPIGDPGEIVGWLAGAVAAPFFRATAPAGLGDWLTDRRARRPSGAQARAVYRDPVYHYPNFYVILSELKLAPDDVLLEVGCGGGAFLWEALKSGCRAAAIDHSVDMVQLAREVNREAVEDGRLTVQQAEADHLPFPEEMFTCAVMTGVFGFLPDPVAALCEIRSVLSPGGRLVMLGSNPRLRGTMAAPEPMASRLHFYEDDELRQLALAAGFDEATVVHREMEEYARQAGVPEEHVALFRGEEPFLLARKA